jgi:hypothetical protein
MNIDSRLKKLAIAASLVGVLGLLAGSSTAAAKCVVSKDTEAIIDDSGSMAATDPDKLRTKLLDLYASIGANNGKVLGGVEFGSDAGLLFSPAKIPGVIPTMDASFSQVDSNNGGTDYDAGFSLGNSTNPKATSRIFLTDGQASPPTQHLHPNIPTYVVGLGNSITSDPSAGQLLQSIASQTKGKLYLVQDATQLQPVAAAITAEQDCASVLTIIRTFNTVGQQFKLGFKAKRSSADILLTWPGAGPILDILGIGAGRASASSVAHAAVKTRKKKGTTFTTVHLKGLKRGQKVKFKIKATTLPSPTVGTTQIIR